ncbi:MAG TPA: ATP-binding protein [Polyangia bacterium]
MLSDGGEMGALMRSIDWAKTPLGPVSGWSQALRTMVGLLLRNRFPMLLWWGPQFVQLYNDAYRPIPGDKHPTSMGQPAAACWREIWHVIGPMIEAPFRGKPASHSDDLEVLIVRNGFLEETHFKVAYSPVPDETVQPTGIGGVLATVAETTSVVFAERQLRTLRALGENVASAETPELACAAAAATLAENARDVPFALFYLLDDNGRTAHLAGSCGVPTNGDVAPPTITLATPSKWPLAEVAERRSVALVEDLRERFAAVPCGAWSEPPHTAIVLPLAAPERPRACGVMIAGVSPHRALDEGYRGFFDLAAGQVLTAIRTARAYQEERKRAEALAAIDRAKTEFFSNVSHEFRTPLTLMLGPTEDARAAGGALTGEALEIVYRNELRLLKLVNNLLDFARLEANRAQASYQATDLGALTKDLASSFRAAIEGAGVELRVTCAPIDEPIFVDHDMWEKIVLNLLSNAFKFTFDGSITVTLAARGERVELAVADTGTGIPEHEIPHLFERFHRVRGARSRSHEGSGIGLALVHELVRLHGGSISVSSRLGQGTTFTVSIPRGRAHLPAERVGGERAPASQSSTAAEAFMTEATRWLVDDAPPAPASASASASAPEEKHQRILLADDNADMRDYVRRILERRWQVEAVADGQAALAAARRHPPDLILTDVMMPQLDGFELVRRIRQDEVLASTSIVMLSARAGDEARVEGLDAGADDYLVKPFSARELCARVETQLKVRRQRLAAEEARRTAEEATRAKDEFMAMLGHELRNPLAPILTTLQVMQLRGSNIFEQERALIDRQVRHVVRLVDDLLEVSRIARGKISLDRTTVDLGETIGRAIELASPLLEQRMHHLTVDVETGLMLDGDKMRLAQVFANLLTNAAKYTASGGAITVTARRVGDRLRMAVKDTGIGIRAELLPVVFDLFVQGPRGLDRSEGGLGLGLSIVKSLVTLHDGTVEALSNGPGKGSEFVVWLPALSSTTAAPSLPVLSHAGRQGVGLGRRVLVVDDNEDAAAALAEALLDLGHAVEVAHDGPQALTKLETFSPDIALLDIGLPLMDGYELARRIRREPRLSGIKLVSITGYGQHSDRLRAQEAGFDVHLVKPVDLSVIERVIADAPN